MTRRMIAAQRHVTEDGDTATVGVDANVLLNLATLLVDAREVPPSGTDPVTALLTAFDVHTPASIIGEATDVAGSDATMANVFATST